MLLKFILTTEVFKIRATEEMSQQEYSSVFRNVNSNEKSILERLSVIENFFAKETDSNLIKVREIYNAINDYEKVYEQLKYKNIHKKGLSEKQLQKTRFLECKNFLERAILDSELNLRSLTIRLNERKKELEYKKTWADKRRKFLPFNRLETPNRQVKKEKEKVKMLYELENYLNIYLKRVDKEMMEYEYTTCDYNFNCFE